MFEYLTSPIPRAWTRILCLFMVFALGYSASATAINSLIASASTQLHDLGRRPRGIFTDRPGPICLGVKPGRDEIGRGGIWTPKLLNDLRRARALEKSRAPLSLDDVFAGTGMNLQSGGDDGGGGTAPGEEPGPGGGTGDDDTGPGLLNTNTGNRHIAYPIVSWSSRGQSGINFALHHNSKGQYEFDLGKGWSHTYDVHITHTFLSSAIIRFGDGTEVPFTESTVNTFVAPAGVHDTLTKQSGVDPGWTLTTKSQWVLKFNTFGWLKSITDRNGNVVTITRDSTQKITSVADGTGRSLTFTYNTDGRIMKVEDPLNREWTLPTSVAT